jgi:radical SAM protein with 4Fe4S-binding SPASM domain
MCNAWKFPKLSITYEQAKRIFPYFRKSLIFHAYGIGEPFLNRDIYDIVKYASYELKFITYITSNFSVINPQKVLEMSADEIIASIDSVAPENFYAIRQGRFELVERNLKILTQLKGEKKYPIISIRTVISKHNIHELGNIIKFGISVNIRKFYLQTLADGNLCSKKDDIDTKDISKIYEVANKYKREAKLIFISYRSDFKGDVPEGYCPVAFLSASIDYRGNVYPCFRVVDDDDASFGNIFYEPQKVLKNRNLFLKKFRSSPPEFCKKCESYFRNFKKRKISQKTALNNDRQ